MDSKRIAKQLVKISKSLTAGKTVKVRIDGEKLVKALINKVRGYYRNGIYFEHVDGFASINGLEVVEQMIENLRYGIKDYRVQGEDVTVTFDVPRIQEFMEGPGSRSMDYSEEDAIDDIEDKPISILASMISLLGSRVDPRGFAVENEQPDLRVVELNGKIVYEGEDKDDADKAYDEAFEDLYEDDELVWMVNGEEFASA